MPTCCGKLRRKRRRYWRKRRRYATRADRLVLRQSVRRIESMAPSASLILLTVWNAIVQSKCRSLRENGGHALPYFAHTWGALVIVILFPAKSWAGWEPASEETTLGRGHLGRTYPKQTPLCYVTLHNIFVLWQAPEAFFPLFGAVCRTRQSGDIGHARPPRLATAHLVYCKDRIHDFHPK